MNSIEFFIPGDAAPAGSKTATPLRKNGKYVFRPDGTIIILYRDASANGSKWRKTVQYHAEKAVLACGWALTDKAVHLHCVFYRQRALSHFKKNGDLNSTGRKYPHPTMKPDVLKTGRAIEDGLTGIIWEDDSQVVLSSHEKRWGDVAGVNVRIDILESPAQSTLFE